VFLYQNKKKNSFSMLPLEVYLNEKIPFFSIIKKIVFAFLNDIKSD